MSNQHHYDRATADSSLLSGVHGRQRRAERYIDKIDLLRARRYGMKEDARNGRIKYTYGGVVFIYCPHTNREVTSFPASDKAAFGSGTRAADPIILSKVEFGADAEEAHNDLVPVLLQLPSVWTSHSVLVVDMSGSMRRDDVNGARCRSDGVWMALARDYVKAPLEKKERTVTDLVSIIVMREKAEVVIRCEPMTWVLYNKLIDMREWWKIRPSGPGNYLPALKAAEKLLTSNANAGCSLSLLFFSDGRPSDKGDFAGKIGALASKFGRRLAITCIGMADETEDFSTLNDMVTEAQSYGSQASFGKPSLDADSLSNIITSLATSLTTSKTEMTELRTGKARLVRMDVTREKHNTPDDVGHWHIYKNSSDSQFVRRIWTWSYRSESDFVEILDPRCAHCYKNVGTDQAKGFICPDCDSYYLCWSCRTVYKAHKKRFSSHRGSQCDGLLYRKRLGKLIRKDLPSFSIAMKENIFGEGAERIVRKVRFLDESQKIIGPPMVAKESRFIESYDSYEERMDYHREFMRTQGIASEYAKKFNEALDNLVEHFPAKHHRKLKNLPRIEFIEPMVVEVMEKGNERNILVEKLLDGDYKKFNNNMGYVDSEVRTHQQTSKVLDDLAGRLKNLDLGGIRGGRLNDLGAIQEEDSDEEETSDDEVEGEDLFDAKESAPDEGTYRDIKDAYFPQAFSHFTYEKSKRNFMVVDLQGVFTINADGTRCYELTDPVIHKHRKKARQRFKTWTFGRTDRGEKGMKAFFETHQCTNVCRLLGLAEKS